MQSIDLKQSWTGMLPILLVIYADASTAEARSVALGELKRMAVLADAFGKQLCIELYPMAGESIAEDRIFTILVRPDGEDPILEYENMTREEAQDLVAELQAKLPGGVFVEIGG